MLYVYNRNIVPTKTYNKVEKTYNPAYRAIERLKKSSVVPDWRLIKK